MKNNPEPRERMSCKYIAISLQRIDIFFLQKAMIR